MQKKIWAEKNNFLFKFFDLTATFLKMQRTIYIRKHLIDVSLY